MVVVCLLPYAMLSPKTGKAREFFAKQEIAYESIVPQGLNVHHPLLTSDGTSLSMVRTIMALLATFDEAGILPPEGTAQANQVIHAFIQLQSALMKSPSPELAAYRDAADASWVRPHEDQAGSLADVGLTDKRLAGLIAYNQEHPLWENPKIRSAMKVFNVTEVDWLLAIEIYKKADAVFRQQGRSIHIIYQDWRMKVSGGKS